MSPRAFHIEMMLGRSLSRRIEASSEEVAVEIAQCLHQLYGDSPFEDSGETVIDINAELIEQVQS